jgi:hypothetical protein
LREIHRNEPLIFDAQLLVSDADQMGFDAQSLVSDAHLLGSDARLLVSDAQSLGVKNQSVGVITSKATLRTNSVGPPMVWAGRWFTINSICMALTSAKKSLRGFSGGGV